MTYFDKSLAFIYPVRIDPSVFRRHDEWFIKCLLVRVISLVTLDPKLSDSHQKDPQFKVLKKLQKYNIPVKIIECCFHCESIIMLELGHFSNCHNITLKSTYSIPGFVPFLPKTGCIFLYRSVAAEHIHIWNCCW